MYCHCDFILIMTSCGPRSHYDVILIVTSFATEVAMLTITNMRVDTLLRLIYIEIRQVAPMYPPCNTFLWPTEMASRSLQPFLNS